jgi:hypothetical protein
VSLEVPNKDNLWLARRSLRLAVRIQIARAPLRVRPPTRLPARMGPAVCPAGVPPSPIAQALLQAAKPTGKGEHSGPRSHLLATPPIHCASRAAHRRRRSVIRSRPSATPTVSRSTPSTNAALGPARRRLVPHVRRMSARSVRAARYAGCSKGLASSARAARTWILGQRRPVRLLSASISVRPRPHVAAAEPTPMA